VKDAIGKKRYSWDILKYFPNKSPTYSSIPEINFPEVPFFKPGNLPDENS